MTMKSILRSAPTDWARVAALTFSPIAAIGVGIIALLGFAASAACIELPFPSEKLTLKRAIELTLKNHPKAMQSRAESDAARERVGEARSALLPQLYGAAEYLGATDNPIGNTTYLNTGIIPRITGTLHGGSQNAVQDFSPGNNFLTGVGVDQYLYDFGRVRGRIEQSRFEANAASDQSRTTDLQLIFIASQRYFALLAAEQKVKVYQKAILQRTEQLHEADVKAAASLVSQIDVLTAQAQLSRAKLDLVQAENLRDVAKIALDDAMSIGPNPPAYELTDVMNYQTVAGDPESYFSDAKRRRPDLKAIELMAQSMGAQIQEVRSDYFPTFHAVAGYESMGTGLPAANNYHAGLLVTWPIFNGFLTDYQLSEMRAHRKAILYAIDDLTQHIWLEVNSAYVDLKTSIERIHQAEKTLAASSGQLELAEKRYTAGLGNIIELTDAERLFVQDDAAYVDALYSYSVARAELDRATAASLPYGP